MIKIFIAIFIVVSAVGVFLLSGKLRGDDKNTNLRHTNSAIYKENQKDGTEEWKRGAFGDDALPVENEWKDINKIYGYSNLTSVNAGEAIELKISTVDASYSVDIYRMGWYGGKGATLIQSIKNLKGQKYEMPKPQSDSGLLELKWPTAYTVKTEQNWTSGVYLAKLTTNDKAVGFINFVVRDDNAVADILYQLPVTTYQAYNNWGGKSIYDYNSNNVRTHKVSFDRPYATSRGAGPFFDGDYNMIRFLEKEGYDVTYVTSVDLEENPQIVNGRKVFLSNWHDEYWSGKMRDNITSARDSGIDLAFFSANNIYFQIRFESSAGNNPNRVMVCYKDAGLDPVSAIDPSLTTVHWRDEPVKKPENELLGVMYSGDVEWGKSAPWIVKNSGHWIYKGTKLKDGDEIEGLVGYEYDSFFDDGNANANLELLSMSPITGNTGPVVANSAIYTATSGARVFSAGTIYWPWKLDDNDIVARGADKRVQTMTKNILDAMIENKHL